MADTPYEKLADLELHGNVLDAIHAGAVELYAARGRIVAAFLVVRVHTPDGQVGEGVIGVTPYHTGPTAKAEAAREAAKTLHFWADDQERGATSPPREG